MLNQIIMSAVNTYREASAAMADADSALTDACPPYIARALTYKGTKPADRERLVKVLPYLPTDGRTPDTLSPYTVNADAFIEYRIDTENWRDVINDIRDAMPGAPVGIHRAACTSVRPMRDGDEERADFVIEADAASGDYPHTLTVKWWWVAAEGVTVEVRCTLTHYSATSLVRYTLDNPPRNHGRQHPEDRRWSVSWTLGSGSASIKWWTSPGNKPRMTWTWPPGTSLNHALTAVRS